GYGHKIVKNFNGRTRLYFDDNLYVRESSRTDATGAVVVLWRCRRNYDMCGVKALQYEDGLVEVLGEHDHSSIKATLKIPENVTGTTAYDMLPTVKGGETMLLGGNRYVKAYCRPNGMSLWRCVGSGGVICRAKVTMSADGVAYVARNATHLHGKPKSVKNMAPKMVENSVSSPRIRAIKADESVDKKLYCRSAGSTESDASTPCTTICKPDKTVRKAYDKGVPAAANVAPSQTVKPSAKSQPMRNYRVIRNKKGNKALVHAGYRYCRVRTRLDGSVSWVCKINKKTCRVPVYEHPDGRLEWTSHRRHNHGPTDPIDPPKKVPPQLSPPAPVPAPAPVSGGKRTAYHIDDDTFVNNEWFFVRNHKNGTTLIHAGHRYHKKGIRVNDTSLWRCAQANHGCRAAIVLHPDETIAKFDDIDHTHPPPNTAMEEMEVIVGDPDESMERNNTSNIADSAEPELSLVHFNGCIEEQDDPEANMRSLLNTMLLDVSDDATNRSTEKVMVPAAKAHLKYVTNRRHTKSLVFRGYRYARASMGVRADGSVRWSCQMNKKTCRVSVRVLKDGSVEINEQQKHNHAQLPEDRESNNGENDDYDAYEPNDTNASICNDDTSNSADESDDSEAEAGTHYFALNRSNGKSLIFQRNRFSRENARPDGSTIWRCMVRSDCLVKVVLQRNNTCVLYRDAAHNHPPLDVLPPPLHLPVKRVAAKLIVKGDMLVYKHNRMKKTKSFSDGTALFKCTEAPGCTGIVKIRYEETEYGASSPVVVFDMAHNHPNVLVADAGGKSKRKSPVKMLKYSPTDGGNNGKAYQLFKNDRGHVSLVYKGYRFSLGNLNAKGDSSWKCRANRMCNAYVSFTKDGHVLPNAGKGEPKVMPHNHPINGEYIEGAVPLVLDQLHPPAHDLSQFVSNWLRGLYKSELGGKGKASAKSTTIQHSSNERKHTIYHRNFSYKLQTTKNGREFWRCTMFKARACRAGLFCTNNGTIIQYENGRAHNHEPSSKPLTASIGQQSNSPRKSFLSGGAKEKANDGAYSPLSQAQHNKSIKRSQSALPFEEQSTDETVAPTYQIVKRDGIDTLHYERHRYAVSFSSKREDAANGKEPKRWRCCLWNSRHQCPVELTISPTDEIHFVTDPTHNHRPPPPESQETLDRQSVVASSATKGTKKYELMGRSQKTVFYKGHKFSWKEEGNGTTYYRCMCHSTHDCAVTVKIDVNGMLYECSTVSHNHSPTLDMSADSVPLAPKRMTERNLASRQTRLEQCSATGSSDYRFVRSCLGNSMIFEGHRYWLHSKLSCGLNVYRCRYQKQKDCSGSVYMDANTRLLYHRYDAEHSHEPLAEDALAGLEQDTTNTSLNVSELNVSSGGGGGGAHGDDIDERELDTSSSSTNNNLHQSATIVPKKEVIVTQDYSFMKDSLSKNQLFYDQYVFEMVPLQYRKNGDKFYGCLFADCPSAVKLLASGGLDISNPIHHTHERPDLTDYRDVGRGSSDFLTLFSNTAFGTKPMIRFEGYDYCASTVLKPLQDDTKLYHCQEKNRAAGRCSATLEMLPNGRVIATGTHHHPKPNQTETDDSKETAQSKIIVLGGRSYVYLETQADGTSVWRCTDDP
uniref:FLYWCH-type domain-containing protein n=1 Tax=Anopheles maculatus TaxID=74869 RepID=A0A182SQA8_9DIPT